MSCTSATEPTNVVNSTIGELPIDSNNEAFLYALTRTTKWKAGVWVPSKQVPPTYIWGDAGWEDSPTPANVYAWNQIGDGNLFIEKILRAELEARLPQLALIAATTNRFVAACWGLSAKGDSTGVWIMNAFELQKNGDTYTVPDTAWQAIPQSPDKMDRVWRIEAPNVKRIIVRVDLPDGTQYVEDSIGNPHPVAGVLWVNPAGIIHLPTKYIGDTLRGTVELFYTATNDPPVVSERYSLGKGEKLVHQQVTPIGVTDAGGIRWVVSGGNFAKSFHVESTTDGITWQFWAAGSGPYYGTAWISDIRPYEAEHRFFRMAFKDIIDVGLPPR